MYSHFFSKIDILPDNTNILDGEAEDLLLECSEYERKIKAVGGIDIFLGGMGEDGHLAFNEVHSSFVNVENASVSLLTFRSFVAWFVARLAHSHQDPCLRHDSRECAFFRQRPRRRASHGLDRWNRHRDGRPRSHLSCNRAEEGLGAGSVHRERCEPLCEMSRDPDGAGGGRLS